MRKFSMVFLFVAGLIGFPSVTLAQTPGTIATVAGGGSGCAQQTDTRGDGCPALDAELNYAVSTATDSSGNLYISDGNNEVVRKVSASGVITTIAGTGSTTYSGDGGQAINAGITPWGLAFDPAGNLYISDILNNRVRKVSTTGVISTFAGNGTTGDLGDGGQATSASVEGPAGIAFDSSGNLYIVELSGERVRKVTPAGIITTVAGNGTKGFAGDGGAATSAELNLPLSVAVDAEDNLYIADQMNSRIRKVTASGTISTFAGNGTFGYSGDGGAAASSILYQPVSVAVDNLGNLYIADQGNNRIRRVTKAGTIGTVAGNGTAGDTGDGSAATSAEIDAPQGVGVDQGGNVEIAEAFRIRKVISAPAVTATALSSSTSSAPAGAAVTFTANVTSAGTTSIPTGSMAFSVDGTAAATVALTASGTATYSTSKLGVGTHTVAASYAGNANFAASTASLTETISQPQASAPVFSPAVGSYTFAQAVTITDTIAGAAIYYTTNATVPTTASTRYTGAITVSTTETIQAIAVATGYANSAVASATYTILTASPAGVITDVAGNGTSGYSGDGAAATSAELNDPDGVVVDSAGNFYIADTYNNVIRKVAATGTITTYAGTGNAAYSGDGGQAIDAEINYPTGVALDTLGNLYIADNGNHRIRKVTVNGIITTFAGNGTAGYSGNGGQAVAAKLNNPTGLAFDTAGNLYIADWNNHVVRKVAPTGLISTVAGTGTQGYSGDGGAATSAELNFPYGVALDPSGNLYIGDSTNFRVRKVSGGTISTVAGTGSYGYSGDGGPAIDASLAYPNGVAVDGNGNLYIADGTNRVRRVNAAGEIVTVAGNGTAGNSGNGGPATSAEIHGEIGLALDSGANLYIADTDNSAIRKVSFPALPSAATPTFSVAAGTYTAAQSVTLADATTGAAIYYTTNGTAPTTASTKYTGAIAVSATEKIEAIAVATGYSASAVASATYTIALPAATPTFSVAAGTYTSAQSVTIADATAGAVIYYTTNGTTPSTASTKYAGAIAVSASETIEAIAVATGYTTSAIASAAYTIVPPAATPTFSVASGTYPTAQSVTIADATAGATIYYTTNGTAPTTASTKYAGSIPVSATETLEAIAVATGYSTSAVATAKYTIVPVVATPVFSVQGGLYATGLFLTLTDATPGATIYYTSNGSLPTNASTKYTAPIPVTANETVESIAAATGDTNSPVATAVYQIAGAPYALAMPASAIGTTTATLNAVVNPGPLTGTYVFHYGTSSTALSQSSATVSIGFWTAPEQVAAAITGLTAKTTYYYQVVVTTGGGVSSDSVQSFTTE
jgi:sugar lactone lactonase YvrE